MMIEIILAVVFSLLGLMVLLSAGVMTNVCHYQYKAYNDVTFYSEIQPNELNAKKFFDACLYKTSPGLITSYLTGTELDSFNKLMSTADGVDAYNDWKTSHQGQTELPKITAYKTTITNAKSFSTDDFTKVAVAHKPQTVLDSANAFTTCATDTWVLNSSKCPSGYTIFAVGNAQTGLTGKTCIVVQTFVGAGYTANGRYAGSCVTNISTVQTYLTNLNGFSTSADSLYTSMVSGVNGLDSGTGPATSSDTLLTKLTDSATHWGSLETLLTNQWAFIKALDNKSSGLKNCTILNQDMVIFSDSVCWSFGKWFVYQSIFFAAIGPIMLMMSILMCGSMRCPLDTSPKKKYIDVDYPGKPIMSDGNGPQQIHMKNGGNYNYPSKFG